MPEEIAQIAAGAEDVREAAAVVGDEAGTVAAAVVDMAAVMVATAAVAEGTNFFTRTCSANLQRATAPVVALWLCRGHGRFDPGRGRSSVSCLR